VKFRWSFLHRGGVLGRRYGHSVDPAWQPFDTMGAPAFADALRGRLEDVLGGRQVTVRAGTSWGAGKEGDVYINFVNLPQGVGAAGGGAEAENNRASFWIRGFGRADAPSPSGKLKIEQSNTVFRKHKLRGRTAAPGAIAKYLVEFLARLVREVEPHFTHTNQEWHNRALGEQKP
jgi:hypothetical protein